MFLDYLIRLTVLSLHHGYTLYISHDYCLYYISFVYLKSFKELFLISKLPFVSESVCKGKRFFLNHQIFFEVFFEKIFQRSETGTGSPSRSLSTAKVRYKATPEKPETSRSLCQCFTAFLSRKRVQNYALFRKLQLLHDFFLTVFQSFFVKRWKTGMLRGIFFQHTQKEEENMHNNIYCAGGRMCAKENTPHYPQKTAQWKNNAFSSLKQRHVFTKNTPSFFKITAYFFRIKKQADYQYRRECIKQHCFFT